MTEKTNWIAVYYTFVFSGYIISGTFLMINIFPSFFKEIDVFSAYTVFSIFIVLMVSKNNTIINALTKNGTN